MEISTQHLQQAIVPPTVASKDTNEASFAQLLNQASPTETVIDPLHLSNTLGSNLDTEAAQAGSEELKKAFQDFVGQTFFGELIKSYRSTQQESAYFNGGRAEKIFQGQLDQVLSQELSERSADKIADPMYEQFMLRRAG